MNGLFIHAPTEPSPTGLQDAEKETVIGIILQLNPFHRYKITEIEL